MWRNARVVALALALAGCVDLPPPVQADEGAAPMHGGILELAMIGDVTTLDPAEVWSALDASVAANVYAGLVDVDAEGRVVPVLAERVDVDDATGAVRVVLRRGLRYHDGATVDAASIAASFRRLLAPSAPSMSIALLEKIRGAEAFRRGAARDVEGLVVEGPLSLRMDLVAFDAAFVPSLALVPARPVCPSAAPVGDGAFIPCGAGPFRLARDGWTRGHSLKLERFDGWFRTPYPLLDGVRWRLRTPSRTQQILLERGELHATRDLASHAARALMAAPAWAKLREREASTTFWGEAMNAELPPFDNVEVRRAVATAIDRRAIVALDPLRLREGTGPLPPGAAGFDPSLRCQRFDRDAALEHMRRAGFAYDAVTGSGGYPSPVPYLAAARTFTERSAQLLQAQLASIGIRLAPRLVSNAAFYAASRRRRGVPMSSTGWTQDFPDPSNFFDALYHRRSIAERDGTNTSFYGNARLDALLDGAHASRSEVRRRSLFEEASRVVCDEAPIAFTHVPEALVFRQAFVRDFVAHPVWLQDIERTWLARRTTAASAPSLGPAFGAEVGR